MFDVIVTILVVTAVCTVVGLMLSHMVDFFWADQYTRKLFRKFFRL